MESFVKSKSPPRRLKSILKPFLSDLRHFIIKDDKVIVFDKIIA